jgi:hypothetical protein
MNFTLTGKKLIVGLVISILLLVFGLVFYFAFQPQNKNQFNNSNTVKNTDNVIPVETGIQEEEPGVYELESGDIDTSDWLTYRNEEYGFEFKYPSDWEVEVEKEKVYIWPSVWRDGLPEGGAGVSIESSEISLEQFIDNYNSKEEFTEIINQQNYEINSYKAVKLTGTTAIGINDNFLFIYNQPKNYVVSFHDFDKYHIKILSTVKLFGSR